MALSNGNAARVQEICEDLRGREGDLNFESTEELRVAILEMQKYDEVCFVFGVSPTQTMFLLALLLGTSTTIASFHISEGQTVVWENC